MPDPAKLSFGSCSLPEILETNGLVVVCLLVIMPPTELELLILLSKERFSSINSRPNNP